MSISLKKLSETRKGKKTESKPVVEREPEEEAAGEEAAAEGEEVAEAEEAVAEAEEAVAEEQAEEEAEAEAEAEKPKRERGGKRPKKGAAGVPALPSHSDIEGALSEWQDFYEQLGELINRFEEEEEEEEGSDIGEESGDEGSDLESEEEEETEEQERERYVAETLAKRHERSKQVVEWGCYAIEPAEGEQPEPSDVQCCLGDECAYVQNPELLARPAKAERSKRRGKMSAEELAAEAEARKIGYRESRRLMGTGVWMCDRCFDEAKKEINAATERARLAAEGKIEEKEEKETAKGKKKGKKGSEEAEEKEVPLVIPAAVSARLEEEYNEQGLPRKSKAPPKKKRRSEEEEEEGDEDENSGSDVESGGEEEEDEDEDLEEEGDEGGEEEEGEE